MGIKETAEAVRKFDNYVITSHINAEGDAIGSELAILNMVKQLGKKGTIVNSDPVPARYHFLPGWDKIATGEENHIKKGANVIAVDCPTVARIGPVGRFLRESHSVINIDHHVSNEHFGHFNWVEPESSSCGEMIFKLYKHLNLHINEDVALMLYVSVLTDTGSFRYDSTSRDTHYIAGELLKSGIKPDNIHEHVYGCKEMADIRLLAKALSTTRVTADGKIAYMTVTKDMLDETRTTADRTDGFINFVRSVKGVEIAILFRQSAAEPHKIHAGFRSTGKANVNTLASAFDGGGHPKASGCALEGNMEYVTKKILSAAKEFLV